MLPGLGLAKTMPWGPKLGCTLYAMPPLHRSSGAPGPRLEEWGRGGGGSCPHHICPGASAAGGQWSTCMRKMGSSLCEFVMYWVMCVCVYTCLRLCVQMSVRACVSVQLLCKCTLCCRCLTQKQRLHVDHLQVFCLEKAVTSIMLKGTSYAGFACILDVW